MAKQPKKELKLVESRIIDELAIFKTPEQVAELLKADGIECTADDVAVFGKGRYKSKVEARSDAIAEALPIASRAFCIMELDKILKNAESAAEKLTAIRLRGTLMKTGKRKAMTAADLSGDEDE